MDFFQRYQKCILLNGCIFPNKYVIDLINRFFDKKYIYKNKLSELFDDDICTGIMCSENNLELRKYKVCSSPVVEEYYLIINKIVLNFEELESVRLELVDPNMEEINKFMKIVSSYGLTWSKFFICTS